uniref:Secreted protein n=1 Tax=Glycine max TaxID=3847 RepID=K7K3F0_SOYBN
MKRVMPNQMVVGVTFILCLVHIQLQVDIAHVAVVRGSQSREVAKSAVLALQVVVIPRRGSICILNNILLCSKKSHE